MKFFAFSRRACLTFMVAGLAAAVMPLPALAQPAGAPKQEVLDQQLMTPDGWTLPITYFKSGGGRETPVVLMLHGGGGNRAVWNSTLAKKLHELGYAVITVDLRKHGEATPPGNLPARLANRLTGSDYQSMLRFDMETLKDFLLERHLNGELNIRKLAIVASDDMAPIAANYAYFDWIKKPYPDAPTLEARTPRGQDVRALVLLSPSESVPGVNLGGVLNNLRNPLFGVTTFILVGADDKEDKGTARKTYDRLTAPDVKDRVFLESFDRVKDRGMDLITNRSAAEGRIIIFLDKYLKGLTDPWVDRKSRL